MKALVTGATGFIGSHLAEALLRKGHEVSCLVRKTSKLAWLDSLDVRLFEGDCSDINSLQKCVQGQDYVFHLAGVTKAYAAGLYYSVNAKGTENLIASVAENNSGIRKFVYLSSLSAFGPGVKDRPPREDEKPHPVSDYGKSKLQGEHAVLRYADRLPVTILRPSIVYGPRDREFFWFFKTISRGIMPYWGEGHTSLIYVDDLIRAVILAAGEDASGRTYFVSDGEMYSNNEIINEIAAALEVRVRRVRTPRFILPAIGFLGGRISKMFGKNSMINADKIKEIMHPDWVCDIEKAKGDLCFQPRVDVKKGIKWTADWYRIHRWL
ncbi:MAG: NAD-dependent epimerase/dehydratase family protein [Nitrospirae bacterium]|nr:NAD-dependent epimerase/dehydratase family protein [Nitrospirota bacterium]